MSYNATERTLVIAQLVEVRSLVLSLQIYVTTSFPYPLTHPQKQNGCKKCSAQLGSALFDSIFPKIDCDISVPL
jgi:hypothetical protein